MPHWHERQVLLGEYKLIIGTTYEGRVSNGLAFVFTICCGGFFQEKSVDFFGK
jgi:hypothetical protein